MNGNMAIEQYYGLLVGRGQPNVGADFRLLETVHQPNNERCDRQHCGGCTLQVRLHSRHRGPCGCNLPTIHFILYEYLLRIRVSKPLKSFTHHTILFDRNVISFKKKKKKKKKKRMS